jgi:hypothetical protein
MSPSSPIRWFLAVSLLLLVSTAHARPAYRKAMADYFGPDLAPNLNACTTCHLVAKPTDDDHKHNAFGKRLKAVRTELRKAKKKTDIISRILAVADEDSDGDGVPNLIELLSGHGPGDAKDKPSATEIDVARKRLLAFLKSKEGYAWAPFDPVQRPPVPQVKNTAWLHNPIDAFIAAEHERHGLKARPEAVKHVLLRRVYLDLIGLPPTRDEMRAFLADDSANAYEKVVERLLDSPRYGERWGRHWMDVWRYSDWAGYGSEVRESHQHIWRWRDWIIESLNQDKGHDRMVQEMLAGDELAPTDPGTLRATGFLARNWYKFNRNVWLDNTVEHTAKAFLGMTLNCARCHDHMYDPFTQKEYYQFRAFFEAHDIRIDRVPGQADINKDGLARAFDMHLATPTYLFVRGLEHKPDKSKPLGPDVPAVLGEGQINIVPVKLPLLAHNPDKRPFVVAETMAAARNEATLARQRAEEQRRKAAAALLRAAVNRCLPISTTVNDLQNAIDWCDIAQHEISAKELSVAALEAVLRAEQFEDAGKKDSEEWRTAATKAAALQLQLAVVVARRDLASAFYNRRVMSPAMRDEANKKLAAAQAALIKAEANAKRPATTAYKPRVATHYPATSSGRRLALARWITDKQNPLAARVAMNHIWMRHFGKPIVPSVFDFGRNGQPPTHPALLDWMAAEFMRRNWSMKQMHRLIVTSTAYRMDSATDGASAAIDRDNVYLWRMNSRRMEAEVVRDSVLYLAGQLDTTMGGPDIAHHLGLTSRRRSVYFQNAAEKQMQFVSLFDGPNVTECYRRTESIVPQQALAMANSSLVLAQSRLLARRLNAPLAVPRPRDPDKEFIASAFEQVLGRPPTPQEQTECAKFLADQTALLADKNKLSAFPTGPASPVPPTAEPHLRARENLVHVLMNHHEFVTIR